LGSSNWRVEINSSLSFDIIIFLLASLDNFSVFVLDPCSSIIVRNNEAVHGFLVAAFMWNLFDDELVHVVEGTLWELGVNPECFTFVIAVVIEASLRVKSSISTSPIGTPGRALISCRTKVMNGFLPFWFSGFLILLARLTREHELNSAHGSVAASLFPWVSQLDFPRIDWWIKNDMPLKIYGIFLKLTCFLNLSILVLFPVRSIKIGDDETVHGSLEAAFVVDLLNDKLEDFVVFLVRNIGSDPELFAHFLVGIVKTIWGV
jgi:hypothetical protein